MTPLRQRMIEDMQLRNLAAGTQKHYIRLVAGFAKYFGMSPEFLDIEAVRQYQLYLLNERKLSPESINQCIAALKFLYLTTLEMPWTDEYFPHVRRAYNLPVVLSQEEVLSFFDHIPSLKLPVPPLWSATEPACASAKLSRCAVPDIDSKRRLLRLDRSRAPIPLRDAPSAHAPPTCWRTAPSCALSAC